MKTKFYSISAIALLALSAGAVPAGPPPASATVSGKITYTGNPPRMKPLDMSKEPSCAKQHATPVTTENVVTGPDNSLVNVVVYISAGDQGSSTPSQAVTYTQKGCQYLPHVLPMQVNQTLEIVNADQTSHNIHPLPKINSEWNKSQPPGTPPLTAKYDKPEFIPVKCNVHPWMHGYFVVLNTSHYAISGSDGGFSLKGLPPGKYTVTAWHEQYGSQSQEITVAGSESKTVNFTFKVLPY
jgi:plastocyanin